MKRLVSVSKKTASRFTYLTKILDQTVTYLLSTAFWVDIFTLGLTSEMCPDDPITEMMMRPSQNSELVNVHPCYSPVKMLEQFFLSQINRCGICFIASDAYWQFSQDLFIR